MRAMLKQRMALDSRPLARPHTSGCSHSGANGAGGRAHQLIHTHPAGSGAAEQSMALQALALGVSGELRGALGRLGYLCAGGAKAILGAKAIFVAAADLSMLPVPP